MSNTNLKYTELTEWLRASVSYNDETGDIALDGYAGSVVHEWAKLIGVDDQKWFPLHASFYKSEMNHAHDDKLSITIFAVDKSKVGKTADEINEFAQAHSWEVPVARISGTITINQFLQPVKRMSFVVRNRAFKHLVPTPSVEIELK